MTSDSGPPRPDGVPPRRHVSLGAAGVPSEVQRELRAHLQLKEDELVAAGMSPEDAALAARRAFGDADAVARECASEKSAAAR